MKETVILSTISASQSPHHRLRSPHSDHPTPDRTQLSGYSQVNGKIPGLETAEHTYVFGSSGGFE